MTEKYRADYVLGKKAQVTAEKKGFLGPTEIVVDSQRFVDLDDLCANIGSKCNELDGNGYEVFAVMPIVIGQSEVNQNRGGAYLGDCGFSVTRGAVLVSKLRNRLGA